MILQAKPRVREWLRETDPAGLEELWSRADHVRAARVGAQVHLRGLLEISNHCVRSCAYCGLRCGNTSIERYRMSREEILSCARRAVSLGYGTIVLQAGEDPELSGRWVARTVKAIKRETGLAVTLSLGERGEQELVMWRSAGADRYLLRFETSNRELYRKIHPPATGQEPVSRIDMLRTLRDLGYETGSGVMVGLPGQRWDDLLHDLELFSRLGLDMIGLGPWIAHPGTPLASGDGSGMARRAGQVPGDELTTYKMIALARLVCPDANIPATTALATLTHGQGRGLGLARGANVVMPNLTPARYRALYGIYPGREACREAGEYDAALKKEIRSMGRTVGSGRGDSPNYRLRMAG